MVKTLTYTLVIRQTLNLLHIKQQPYDLPNIRPLVGSPPYAYLAYPLPDQWGAYNGYTIYDRVGNITTPMGYSGGNAKYRKLTMWKHNVAKVT